MAEAAGPGNPASATSPAPPGYGYPPTGCPQVGYPAYPGYPAAGYPAAGQTPAPGYPAGGQAPAPGHPGASSGYQGASPGYAAGYPQSSGYAPPGSQNYAAPQHPGYPPANTPGYPPTTAPAGTPGYPPASAPGYPPAGSHAYPAQTPGYTSERPDASTSQAQGCANQAPPGYPGHPAQSVGYPAERQPDRPDASGAQTHPAHGAGYPHPPHNPAYHPQSVERHEPTSSFPSQDIPGHPHPGQQHPPQNQPPQSQTHPAAAQGHPPQSQGHAHPPQGQGHPHPPQGQGHAPPPQGHAHPPQSHAHPAQNQGHPPSSHGHPHPPPSQGHPHPPQGQAHAHPPQSQGHAQASPVHAQASQAHQQAGQAQAHPQPGQGHPYPGYPGYPPAQGHAGYPPQPHGAAYPAYSAPPGYGSPGYNYLGAAPGYPPPHGSAPGYPPPSGYSAYPGYPGYNYPQHSYPQQPPAQPSYGQHGYGYGPPANGPPPPGAPTGPPHGAPPGASHGMPPGAPHGMPPGPHGPPPGAPHMAPPGAPHGFPPAAPLALPPAGAPHGGPGAPVAPVAPHALPPHGATHPAVSPCAPMGGSSGPPLPPPGAAPAPGAKGRSRTPDRGHENRSSDNRRGKARSRGRDKNAKRPARSRGRDRSADRPGRGRDKSEERKQKKNRQEEAAASTAEHERAHEAGVKPADGAGEKPAEKSTEDVTDAHAAPERPERSRSRDRDAAEGAKSPAADIKPAQVDIKTAPAEEILPAEARASQETPSFPPPAPPPAQAPPDPSLIGSRGDPASRGAADRPQEAAGAAARIAENAGTAPPVPTPPATPGSFGYGQPRPTPHKQQSQEATHGNLFITNLKDMDEAELRERFSKCGNVVSVRVLTEPSTGKKKGAGFVRFATAEEAQKALNTLNGEAGMTVRVAENDHAKGGRKGERSEQPSVASTASAGGAGGEQAADSTSTRSPESLLVVAKYAGQEQTPSDNLYLSGLPSPQVDKASLLRVMERLGCDVQRTKMIPDTRGKGYSAAMVQVRDQEQAAAAIQALTGKSCAVLGFQVSTEPVVEEAAPVGGMPAHSNVFVGHLPDSVGEAELMQLFAHCGPIASCRISTDPATGQSKGSGFVRFETIEGAQTAIAQMSGYKISSGHNGLTVKIAAHDKRGKPLLAKYAGHEETPSERIYISGLPSPEVDTQTLTDVFIGLNVVRIRTIADTKGTGSSAAVVQFSTPEEAAVGLTCVQGKTSAQLLLQAASFMSQMGAGVQPMLNMLQEPVPTLQNILEDQQKRLQEQRSLQGQPRLFAPGQTEQQQMLVDAAAQQLLRFEGRMTHPRGHQEDDEVWKEWEAWQNEEAGGESEKAEWTPTMRMPRGQAPKGGFKGFVQVGGGFVRVQQPDKGASKGWEQAFQNWGGCGWSPSGKGTQATPTFPPEPPGLQLEDAENAGCGGWADFGKSKGKMKGMDKGFWGLRDGKGKDKTQWFIDTLKGKDKGGWVMVDGKGKDKGDYNIADGKGNEKGFWSIADGKSKSKGKGNWDVDDGKGKDKGYWKMDDSDAKDKGGWSMGDGKGKDLVDGGTGGSKGKGGGAWVMDGGEGEDRKGSGKGGWKADDGDEKAISGWTDDPAKSQSKGKGWGCGSGGQDGGVDRDNGPNDGDNQVEAKGKGKGKAGSNGDAGGPLGWLPRLPIPGGANVSLLMSKLPMTTKASAPSPTASDGNPASRLPMTAKAPSHRALDGEAASSAMSWVSRLTAATPTAKGSLARSPPFKAPAFAALAPKTSPSASSSDADGGSFLTVWYKDGEGSPSDTIWIAGLSQEHFGGDSAQAKATLEGALGTPVSFGGLGLTTKRSQIYPDDGSDWGCSAQVQLASVEEAAVAIEALNGKDPSELR